MALADPQSIKINGVTSSLPRVNTGNFESEYLSADGLTKLKLSTASNGKRKRQVIRLDLSKITTDPFDSTQNIEVGESVYLVVDRPLAGFTNEEAKKAVEGFVELLSASTFSIVTKSLASES
jgi:hypothetical protein